MPDLRGMCEAVKTSIFFFFLIQSKVTHIHNVAYLTRHPVGDNCYRWKVEPDDVSLSSFISGYTKQPFTKSGGDE